MATTAVPGISHLGSHLQLFDPTSELFVTQGAELPRLVATAIL